MWHSLKHCVEKETCLGFNMYSISLSFIYNITVMRLSFFSNQSKYNYFFERRHNHRYILRHSSPYVIIRKWNHPVAKIQHPESNCNQLEFFSFTLRIELYLLLLNCQITANASIILGIVFHLIAPRNTPGCVWPVWVNHTQRCNG